MFVESGLDATFPRSVTEMTANSEFISLQSNEFRELFVEADSSGRQMAYRTAHWLSGTWWKEAGLPIDTATGKPFLTRDLMLHAAAVTSLFHWQRQGQSDALALQVGSADDALRRFLERVYSRDAAQYFTDEGECLSRAVTAFERDFVVPLSVGSVEDRTGSMGFTIRPPTSDAIEALAELLLEFCPTDTAQN